MFNHMKEEYFKDDKGEWFQGASDLALMIPMLELAGLDRALHVKSPIYYWRDNTPFKTKRKTQTTAEKIIRSRKPLGRV